MSIIYVPQGKAREYSPYAVNLYNGCDHDCAYCYIKSMRFAPGSDDRSNPIERTGVINKLKNDCKRNTYAEQVLFSFTGDPYCKYNDIKKLTRQALEVLNEHDIPVAILTKGGSRCLQDLDLFKRFDQIKIGATLTFINDGDSIEWEPGAALPKDRLETLKRLHDEGIKTWVSLEPVIDPLQTLELIRESHEYVDHYKIGKLNHDPARESKISWPDFLSSAIDLMRKYNKKFYIKKDLAKYQGDIKLNPEELDQDHLGLKSSTRSVQACLF